MLATLAGALLVLCRGPARADSAVTDRVVRWWAAVWLRAAGARVVVDGPEHVEPAAAYVVVSNHQSNLDRMAAAAGAAVVAAGPGHAARGTGRYRLLLCQHRIATPGASPVTRLFNLLVMEPGSLVMERKMLLGVKERAERLARAQP